MTLTKRTLLLLLCWTLPTLLIAQKTGVFTDANGLLKQGDYYYELGLFGQAMQAYQQAASRLSQVNEEKYPMLEARAELGFARSAVRMEQPDGTRLIADFTKKHDPAPAAQQALVEMGNYYYNQKKYDEAIELYQEADAYGLGELQRTEVLFKTGYCYFVKKDFLKAKDFFQQTVDIQNEYYYPSNYYFGLTEFFDNNYDQAINYFQRVSRSDTYNKYTPYYITQIYFAKGEYKDLLTYAIPRAEEPVVRNKSEIHQLIGQAYFELGEYEKAVPYFEYFRENATTIRPEDYYQIGYTFYKTNRFEDAVNNFEQLSKVNSALGQNAMYTMGDCHLKTGNKRSARIAFHLASEMDYDLEMQEQAIFQYAKLSYELGFEQEALSNFLKINASSANYSETQSLIGNLLLQSRDYENSIRIIEQMKDKNRDLRVAYQKLSYLRGLELYRKEQHDTAKRWFSKSKAEGLDKQTKALCSFWLAEIDHFEKKYASSISEMNTFLNQINDLDQLSAETSSEAAHYTQGYNYLKTQQYRYAYQAFEKTIKGIRNNTSLFAGTELKQRILPDALLRAADCLLAENQYEKARSYYDQAIDSKTGSFIYAIYQKAIIEGLMGRTTDKILALEEIAEKYERSSFADDALLELGLTYIKMMRYAQAIRPLQELVNRYEGKSNLINQALLNLGLCSINQGNLSAALDYYKQIFKHNPEPAIAENAKNRLQEIYIESMGDSDAYLEFLQTIPNYKVDDYQKEELSFAAGESQYENGNYEKAIAAYERYLKNYPNGRFSLYAQYHAGDSHARLKAYSKALASYEEVIQRGLSNFYTEALRKAAIISKNHEKDYGKALDYFSLLEPLAESEALKIEAQIGAMECAFLSNDNQKLQSFADLVANNPLSTNEQRAEAAYYPGKLAFQAKDYNTALPYLHTVTELTGEEIAAEAAWMLAEISYQKRDLQAAFDRCSNNISNYGKYRKWIALSVILMSDIYAEQGDILMAENMLNQVINNFREDEEILNTAREKLNKFEEQSKNESKLDQSADEDLLEMDDSSNQPDESEDN